jgi:hypothetical protein
MATKNEYGVGYARNDFAGTTASAAELERLARLVSGPEGAYRYAAPSDDDDAPRRPCNYPESLDDVLRSDLRQCRTWDQARAVAEMKSCQISQTGYAGKGRRASEYEREWADMVFAGSRAKQQLKRVPGTCKGCNSSPCRCLA